MLAVHLNVHDANKQVNQFYLYRAKSQQNLITLFIYGLPLQRNNNI